MSGSAEARLYTLSPDTKAALRKFRLSTSRATKPQAKVYQIDKKTYNIEQDPKAEDTYDSLDELADDLPEHSPRFILLSYPCTLKSGRQAAPYVLLFYMPVTVGAELRMLYAGAKELVRNEAEVGKVLDVKEEDDVRGVGETLVEG